MMNDRYYNSKDSVREYIQMAKGVNGANLIAEWKHYLKEEASLLEIGSGPGSDLEILLKDYRVTGSDYSSEFINHLSNKFPNNVFLNLDAVTLETELKFDGIYSNKVLQHLNDDELRASVLRQEAILHSRGIVCHSFWKGEGEELFKGMLVNYQSEDSLKSLFRESFEILKMETYAEFEEDDSILLIAVKKD